MDNRFWSRGFGRWVTAVVAAAAMLLTVLYSCRHKAAVGEPSGDPTYAHLDSTLRQITDVDSLAAMVKQFHDNCDVKGEILALKHQGTRLRKQSRYQDAIRVHISGLHAATQACDTLEMIMAFNNIGTDYRRTGDLSTANGYHYKALQLSDSYSDHDSPEAIKSRVVTLNGIGNIELEVYNYTVADSVLRLALQGEMRLKSDKGMAINYANLGAVKRALGQPDSAWYYYNESLKYNQMAGLQEGEALCHLHFGELYRDERNFSRAKQEYRIAYDKLKELGETYHWLEACLPLASVCILLGEQEEARDYLHEAETQALRINSKEHQADAYWIHYELALLEGNADKALDYYVKSKELCDSMYGIVKGEEMRRQRIDYESGIKTGEVNSLNNDIIRLKHMRNMIGVFGLLLLLMAAAIIWALTYTMRMRNRTQRMLRQVEETRSLFFTNVVHQLRTPLTAIMGATDNIVAAGTEADPASQRDNVEVIERQGKNLLMLVDRILEVGGVRSALREPDWRTGDAATLVRMIVESYRECCMQRHIELTYVPQEVNLDIDTVPRYLSTILGSLIENAMNYSKDFSKITVTSSVEDSFFIIKVADNGMGITPADLPHVFEPFYRGAQAEHLIDGVGIGLTVVRDMTMAMGGTVKAESVKDNGSVFTVKLPVRHGKGFKERLEHIVAPVANLPKPRRAHIGVNDDNKSTHNSLPLVLVVEDHADVARLVGKVLQRKFSVIYASDGVQALNKMSQQRPDMLITDVKMPLMDGHELCRQVRASSELRTIPIIMLSARNNEADRVKGIEAGADVYLVKPFVREELLAWVNHLLERRWLMQVDTMHLARQATPAVAQEAEPAITCGGDGIDGIDDARFVDKFNEEVEKLLDKRAKLDFDKIALSLKMGESQLRHAIMEKTGKSLTAHVMQLRMQRAMHLLKSRPQLRIGDVAELCGFLDVAYFSRVFRQHYGMTPTQARNSG